MPPLFYAIQSGNRPAVRALLDEGADPNRRTRPGHTALMFAAGYGDAETVRMLLEHGANPRDAGGRASTALARAVGGSADVDHFTIARCQTDVVRALLDADPGLRLPADWNGRFARSAARIGGCRQILALVKER